MRFAPHVASVVFALALGACETTRPVGLNQPEFGNAVRQNIAQQTVNPDAPFDDGPIVVNGARAERAQERYVTDEVEPPADISSQQRGGGQGAAANQ